MKKWCLIISIFFLLSFFITITATSPEYVNVIKYVAEEDISHLEVVTPSNITEITVDVFDENKEMSHSISLKNPVLKSVDNVKNSNNNIFYITKNSVAFNRFEKLVVYNKLMHPQYFEFIDLDTQELNIQKDFYMVAPEEDRYVLYIKSKDEVPNIDDLLRENFHYDYCRKLGQLKNLRIFILKGKPEKEYIDQCVKNGQRMGDIKPTILSLKSGWDKVFTGTYID